MKKPRERYRIGLKLLGKTQDLKILDAGCGFGTVEQFVDAVGIDQSLYNIKQSLKNSIAKKFVTGHLEQIPFMSEYFDKAIMLETLEHVQDEEKCIDELNRVLKKTGQLILSVPNYHLLYNFIDLEHWLIPLLTGRPKHRHYKKTILIETLKDHGFTIDACFERGLPFSAMARWAIFCFDMIDRYCFGGFNGPLGRMARRFFDPLIDAEFRIPTPYGHSLFILAHKRT